MKLTARHDLEAERAVLGAVLLDAAECWPIASQELRGSDFYDPRHIAIWRACEALGSAAFDTMLVRSQLHNTGKLENAGGDEYLLALQETIPTATSTAALSKRIRELALVREVQRLGWSLAGEAAEPIDDVADFLDRAAASMSAVAERRSSKLAVTMLADALSDGFSALAQRQQRGQTLLGYSTQIEELDHTIGGLTPGDLIVLAGRPGTGKTAFANAIKLGIARSTGKPVLSLELEMSLEQLTHRVFATESGVDLRRIRAATLDQQDLRNLARAAEDASRLPIAIVVRRDTRISELKVTARKLVRERGELGLVVVDYLQIAKPEHRETHREREIAQITASLKSLAGEFNCPVLALSQLNRSVESRQGAERRPRLSDLRESGAIEQDADTVLFIHREELYNRKTIEKGIAEIIVGKQRSGPTGFFKLRWVSELTRFESLTPREAPRSQEEFEYGSRSNGRSNGRSTNGHAHHEG